MEQMKRMLALALALVLVLGQVPFGVLAAGESCAHHTHTQACGETCGYVCKVCPVQALVDALPEAVTQQTLNEVSQKLTAIDQAKAGLTEEETALVDFTRYQSLVTAVHALQGQPGAQTPAPVVTDYSLYICGTRLTSEKHAGEGWTYDEAAKTLRITKNVTFNYTEKVATAPYAIMTAPNCDLNIVVDKDATLTITTKQISAIMVQGKLAISGEGMIKIDTTVEETTSPAYAVMATGALTMKDITLETKTTAKSPYAISANGITMEDAAIQADRDITSETVEGSSAVYKDFTVKGSSVLDAAGKIKANQITLSDASHVRVKVASGSAVAGTVAAAPDSYYRSAAEESFAKNATMDTIGAYFEYIGASHAAYTSNGNDQHRMQCKCDWKTDVTELEGCSGGTAATCKTQSVCASCNTAYGQLDSSNHESTEFTCVVNSADNTKHDKKYACCDALAETTEHTGSVTYAINAEDENLHDVSYSCCQGATATEAHELRYTADKNVITYGCAKCPYESKELTLTAPSDTAYTGNPVECTVTGVPQGEEPPAITYTAKEGSALNTDNKPVAIGAYTASITAGEDEAQVTATLDFEITAISLANAVVTLKTGETYTYDGTAKTPEVASVVLDGKTLVKDTDYTVSYSDNTNAGTATVTVTGKGNYGGTATTTFAIGAAAADTTAPAAKMDLIYTGQPQELLTAGVTEGGKWQYKLGESGEYGDSVPTAAEQGTYTVYYKMNGGGNYHDVAEASVTVTIAQRPLTVTADAQTILLNAAIDQTKYQITAGSLLTGHTLKTLTLTPSVTNTPTTAAEITPSAAVIVDADDKDVTANYKLTYAKGSLTVVEHTHSWEYTVNGAVITARCKGSNNDFCPNKVVKLELKAPASLVFAHQNEKEVTVEQTAGEADCTQFAVNTDYTVTYEAVGDTSLAAGQKPVHAGTYKAVLTIGTGNTQRTAELPFEITPAPVAVQVAMASGSTITKLYDGTTAVPGLTLQVSGDHSGLEVESFAANFEDANAGTNKKIEITDIVLEGTDASDYCAEDFETTGTIEKRKINVYPKSGFKYLGEKDSISGSYKKGDNVPATEKALPTGQTISASFTRAEGETAGVYTSSVKNVTIKSGSQVVTDNYDITRGEANYIIYPYEKELAQINEGNVTTADKKDLEAALAALEKLKKDNEAKLNEDEKDIIDAELERMEKALQYQIVTGDGATWAKNNTSGHNLVTNTTQKPAAIYYKTSTATKWSKLTAGSHYSLSSDNKTITLEQTWLKSKSVGTYQIKIAYGEAKTDAPGVIGTIKIASAGANPKSGDSSHIYLWSAMLGTSTLALSAAFLLSRRRRTAK